MAKQEIEEKQEESVRDVHYNEIRDKNRELKQADGEWLISREETSEFKKRRDKINSELIELISRGPNPQRMIPFSEKENWRPRPVGDLALSDALTNKLEDNSIATLGDLQDFWRSGKYLSDLAGIGPESSATIADAFAAYAERHPEVYTGDPEE